MKRLFDEEDDWNEDARVFCDQVGNLVKPLFEKLADNNFSLVDAASIACHVISMMEMELTVKHQFRRKREKQKATEGAAHD